MSCRQRDAKPRGARGNRGRTNRRHPEAAIPERRGERHRCRVVSDHHGLDRRRRRQQRPWPGAHAGAKAADEPVQVRTTRAVVRDEAKARAKRLGEQWRRRRREDIRARRREQRFDHCRMRGDERAGHPCRLAERPHVHDALRLEPEVRQRAAAFRLALAQHAEAVRVVDDEPCVVLVGEREQRRQRRDVAVHAEHGVGRNHLAPRLRRREAAGERRHVPMRIADERRAGQERAVVEARVVQPVGEHRIRAPGERGQDREVREVAGRERERAGRGARPYESRELGFERGMRREVAADEMRRRRSRAPACGAVARRRDDLGMIREAEVIVAREGDELPAVDDDARARRRLERAPAPLQSGGRERREVAFERGDSRRHDAGVSPSLASSERSASTSGLSVVRSLSPWKIELAPARKHNAWIPSPSSRRPADSRTIAFGIVMRATATVRTNSNGSSALSPPNAPCNGVPATWTR